MTKVITFPETKETNELDYNSMSIEQLEKEIMSISGLRAELLTKQKLLTSIMDTKLAEKTIENKISGMSSDEIKAMYKALTQTVQVMPALNASEGKSNV